MAGWLSSATSVFRKPRAEAVPPVYRLECSCGQQLAGRRSAKGQTAVCLNCGAAMFVLPASPYPPLAVPVRPSSPPPKRKASGGAPAARAASTRKPATGSDAEVTASASTAATARSVSVAAPAEPTGPSSGERWKATFSLAPLDRWRRKAFSPLRLVLLGIMLVVAATGWWLKRSYEIDKAQEILATVPRLAEEALEEGDVGAAAKQFAKVRAAIELAGREDHAARRWRQLARETAAATDLAPTSLHELLRETVRAGAGAGVSADSFRTIYLGTWVVIDAFVSRNDDPTAPARFEVDFPIAIGEHQARLVAELPIFERRISAGTTVRVIFAAQLADCRAAGDAPSTYLIELQPESAFLWGSIETYKLLGLPIDGETTKLLSEQLPLMGVEP